MLAGEDAQIFGTLAAGGVGAIAASAHLATPHFARLTALLREGRLVEARAVWRALAPLVDAVFAEPNPALIKAQLALQGEMANTLRLPMTAASAEGARRVAAAMTAL